MLDDLMPDNSDTSCAMLIHGLVAIISEDAVQAADAKKLLRLALSHAMARGIKLDAAFRRSVMKIVLDK